MPLFPSYTALKNHKIDVNNLTSLTFHIRLAKKKNTFYTADLQRDRLHCIAFIASDRITARISTHDEKYHSVVIA